jgi:predicted HTH transcriptional regulator
MEDISEEIAAFLHTKKGGIILYGIDDSGTILGSNIKRQDFDQRIHNSIRNTINPSPNVDIIEKDVMGAKIILVIIPPWDRKSLYQYTKKGRYLIRKGTNKFALQPDELKKLSQGIYVV